MWNIIEDVLFLSLKKKSLFLGTFCFLISCGSLPNNEPVKFDTHTDHTTIRKGVVTSTCGNLYKNSGSYVVSLLDINNNFTGGQSLIDYSNNKKFNFKIGKDTIYVKIFYNKNNEMIASFFYKLNLGDSNK